MPSKIAGVGYLITIIYSKYTIPAIENRRSWYIIPLNPIKSHELVLHHFSEGLAATTNQPCHRKSQELELHLMVCSASTRPSSAVSSTSSRRSTSTGVDRPWLTSSKCRGSRWNAGEAGEIHGEIYGKSMEIYQKSRENHGNLSKIQGKLWTSIKNPGKTMDIYQNPGKTMDIYQKSRENYGHLSNNPGKTMDIYQTIQGKLWKSIKNPGKSMKNPWENVGNLWNLTWSFGKFDWKSGGHLEILWLLGRDSIFELEIYGKWIACAHFTCTTWGNQWGFSNQNRSNNCHPDTMRRNWDVP